MQAAANSSDSRWLTLLPVLLGGMLSVLPEAALERLTLVPEAIFSGEWWRLWTGHFVHFSLLHGIADLGAVLVCGLYVEHRWPARAYALLWLCAPLLLSCSLLLTAPELAEYRGASALAAMFATIAGLALWREQPRLRWALLVLGTLFALKTLIDALKLPLPLTVTDLPSDVQVVWQAHVIGMLLGFAWFYAMPRVLMFAAIASFLAGCSSHLPSDTDPTDENLLVSGFPGLPRDARDVVERLASCAHFAGEINGDRSERDKEVFAIMTQLRCDNVEQEAQAISAKYPDNREVQEALKAAQL
jgi:rhomboid family GlyGly-CTERM serine protease